MKIIMKCINIINDNVWNNENDNNINNVNININSNVMLM